MESLEPDIVVSLLNMLPVESRLALCMVSRHWREAAMHLTPRHYMTALVTNQHGRGRDRIATKLHRPRRAIHRPPALSYLSDDSVSELTIDLSMEATQDVAPELAAAPQRFQGCLPPSVISICGNWDRMQQVLCHLPASLYGSMRTLVLVRRYVEDHSLQSVITPLTMNVDGKLLPSVPTLRTLKMMRVLLDVRQLPTVFPNLVSLHVAECSSIHVFEEWEHLTNLVDLKDLSVTNRSGYAGRHILDVIPQLVGLTRLRLMGVHSVSLFTTVTTLSNLLSLSLRRAFPSGYGDSSADVIWMNGTCQLALDTVAKNNLGLQHLELDTHPNLNIPLCLTVLTSIMVLHTTVVPTLLSSLRDLVIRRTPTSYHYPGLLALPRHLTRLRAPYDELRAALECHDLVDLTWRPHPQEDVQDKEQLELLVAVRGGSTWPLLQKLAILPQRTCSKWQLTDATRLDQMRRHCLHSAQLLAVLAARPHCSIESVCLFQRSSHDFGAITALCSMPVLSSVTLVKMRVTVTQLRTLVAVPSMRIVELVGVTRITRKQVDDVRAEEKEDWRGQGTARGVRLLWREMTCVLCGLVDEDEMDDALSYGLM